MNKIGDILVAMYGATIGKLAIVGAEMTTNQACCGCTPFQGVYNMFLFYLLRANKDMLIGRGEGGAQPNISKIKIRNLPVPLPPYAEQQRIVLKVEEMIALCNELRLAKTAPVKRADPSVIPFRQPIETAKEIGIAARGDATQSYSPKLQGTIGKLFEDKPDE